MPRAVVHRTDWSDKGLGRHVPDDFEHVEKYPLRAVLSETPLVVNKTLALPWWYRTHDQGQEGACVGFGTTMMMAILNTQQRKAAGTRPYTVRYDPWWLWDRAKEIDYWPETNPGDSEGTSVRAACEIARDKGLVRYKYTSKLLERLGFQGTPDPAEGIATYRWAESVDQMRAAIAAGLPISIGVNWYDNFDRPQYITRPGTKRSEPWIGVNNDGTPSLTLGRQRGGHCVCIYGASDRRQAFRVKNSWGASYPLVWLPYDVMARLLDEYGEACIITDR